MFSITYDFPKDFLNKYLHTFDHIDVEDFTFINIFRQNSFELNQIIKLSIKFYSNLSKKHIRFLLEVSITNNAPTIFILHVVNGIDTKIV